MIYTCTLNPSVDYLVRLSKFKLGELNRNEAESFSPGGKGINVSLVLHNLGIESTLLGFLAGFTGKFIEESLLRYSLLKPDFIYVTGNTRINLKLKADGETELNGLGPTITEVQAERLISQLSLLTNNDIFILSGSIPVNCPIDYQKIAEKVTKEGAMLVVDGEKHQLLSTLPYQPFLIKPNKKELEDIFSVKLDNLQDIVIYGKKLLELGARNVIISLGADGAIFLNEKYILKASAPQGILVNSVGSGDSMVAGFIAQYIKGKPLNECFRFSVACGSATAFSEGLATEEEINKLLNDININDMKEDI